MCGRMCMVRTATICEHGSYVQGQQNANFNLRIFFGWQLFGLVQSLVVFFIPYGCYAHVSTRPDGLLTDMWSLGTLVMTVICIVVNVGTLLQASSRRLG